MSEVNSGGQAFPLAGFPGDPNFTLPKDGMTLRQWYAGQALAGLLASSLTTRTTHGADAKACVKAADALIAELEKETHED